ncbi:MAG: AbrB/MazE/SpoVT family DNA-binding domain-containing protein [Chloracidobacterium sp.]|nr:AbrB/MazE/SpoVT family DNA-binding domain-containing protein [Chloracidobacterium sp.]
METVTVSSKFQITILSTVRESLKISPGDKLRVICYGNHIELVPERPIEEFRGILSGKLTNTNIEREDDRL